VWTVSPTRFGALVLVRTFSPARVALDFAGTFSPVSRFARTSSLARVALVSRVRSRPFRVSHARFRALIFVWMFLSKSVYGFTLNR
jgi:hypothetical protein